MSTNLDNTRANRGARTIMDENISQLMQLDTADVELSFEVRARTDKDISILITRASSENCSTLLFWGLSV